MALPRLSLRGSMLVVGLLAVNFAAAQRFFERNAVLMAAVALYALALELMLIRLVRERRLRPFCIGFLAVGLVVLLSYVWGEAFPRNVGIGRWTDPKTGQIVESRRIIPGSTMWALWNGYDRLVWRTAARWPAAAAWLDEAPEGNPRALDLVEAVVRLAPQFLLASSGGLIAWGLARVVRRREPAPAAD